MKLLYKKADTVLIKHLRRLDLASSNGIIEYPLVALKFLSEICKKIALPIPFFIGLLLKSKTKIKS